VAAFVQREGDRADDRSDRNRTGNRLDPRSFQRQAAHAALTTLSTTATIPAAVSVGCHAPGVTFPSCTGAPEGAPETATRYGSSSGETRR
jgi:hypothetical protein